ncbi:MAG TPA: cyclic nucleotide-binding domain-containing protein [Xanthobacteraceae bacterium]|nr:cyclic nucleotide-binding domain-containing protein [Xanthobacteraceae bacterium]
MTIEDDIAYLDRIPFLRRLGTGALRILAIGVESYDLQPGQVLFAAGEPADGAYIIQRGFFNLKPERAGEPELVAGPGTLLGESALLAETRRPATATARESATVMRISRSMFLRMLEGYPDAAQRLREMMASRADQWAREMENVRTALLPGMKPQ